MKIADDKVVCKKQILYALFKPSVIHGTLREIRAYLNKEYVYNMYINVLQ